MIRESRLHEWKIWADIRAFAGIALISISELVFSQVSDFESIADDEIAEEIVVTGSRIKRQDFFSPSPLVTVDREDFEFSGQPTLEEHLNQMPQVQPDFGRTANNPGDGTARINLRGLGAGRTLILLNGRRVAPSGVTSAVDINNLPRALMERAEIVTGGASTVYGSDAIAGAINFVTRNDYEGIGVDGSYSLTAEGDAEIYDANITYGHQLSGGQGNITIFASHYNRDYLYASERELTRTVWLDTWEGELIPWGSPVVPGGVVLFPRVDLGSGQDQATWNPDGTPRAFDGVNDLYNYAPVNYLQTPLSRNTVGLMATIKLSDRIETYLEAAYTRNEARRNAAPAPFQSSLSVNTDNPQLTPETRQLFEQQLLVAPGVAGMFLGRRMQELGTRITDQDYEYARIVVGMRGEFAENWGLDAWVTYTDASESVYLINQGSISNLQQGMLVDPASGQCLDPSGSCVPLDIFGEGRLSEAGADFVRFDPFNNTTNREQFLAAVVVTGAPFETWAGPVDMAFGAEWRNDDGTFIADDALFTGDVMGIGGATSVDGSESVYELYTEALVPVIENADSEHYLALELGARYSDYENAGSVWTYKAGLQWQPITPVNFRAMLQHAVRAPNLSELFTEQAIRDSFAVTNFRADPCSASQDPVGNGVADKCVLQGLPADQVGIFEATPFYPVDFLVGGNPALEPESSDTLTVGVVIAPSWAPELTLAVDYFDLEVADTIGEISASQICFDPVNTANEFCENISRDNTGNIGNISQLTSNRGLLGVEGIDTQIEYASDLPSWMAIVDNHADLSINSTWTHLKSVRSQDNIATETRECVGLFGAPCDTAENGISFPEDRVTTNLDYASGSLNIHLTWRWITGMDNAAPLYSEQFGVPDPDLAVPDVSASSYFDLGFGYQFSEHLNVRLGINNLTNEQAPQMADAVRSNNTDTRLYDIFGRTYYLSFNYSNRK